MGGRWVRVQLRPGAVVCLPLPRPCSSSEQWRWQRLVCIAPVSVAGRILEFKYFSFFNRQPSQKCNILQSWWSYKDSFNCILSHVGETLRLKSASAVLFLSYANNDVGSEQSPPWSDSIELVPCGQASLDDVRVVVSKWQQLTHNYHGTRVIKTDFSSSAAVICTGEHCRRRRL